MRFDSRACELWNCSTAPLPTVEATRNTKNEYTYGYVSIWLSAVDFWPSLTGPSLTNPNLCQNLLLRISHSNFFGCIFATNWITVKCSHCTMFSWSLFSSCEEVVTYRTHMVGARGHEYLMTFLTFNGQIVVPYFLIPRWNKQTKRE